MSALTTDVSDAREIQPPTLPDVLTARRRIAPHLPRTPTYRYAGLSELLGTDVLVKHENHLPTAAFKVRGGVNLVSQLTAEERRRGVIAASTGNHGQSVAFAASIFGVLAIVCAPENANPVKVAAMRGFGAEVIFHGPDFDAARVHAEVLSRERGYRYIHSGDEPLLIAGVGTAYLEMLEDEPHIDVIIVPIGGGSGAAAACIVAAAINPNIRIVGVQSEAAPAAYRSWRERRMVEDRMGTYAEGLATRTAFALPQRILWERLHDFVLVSDDEIRTAQAVMIETTINMTEAAAAATLAAALQLRDELAGQKVALVNSGGNVSREQLVEVMSRAAS
ncbi:MAG: threonine/serine dehydratase [Candidatus Limnocylindrales bacterium]